MEHATRAFGTNKISPDNSRSKETSLEDIVNSSQNANSVQRKKFKNVAEYALLYAGSQRGKLDQISLIVFPLSFLLFTIVYWTLYLSESRKKI